MNNLTFPYTDCCRTCLRLESGGTPLSTLDTDNIKICDKLLACVSDIVRLRSTFFFILFIE